MTKTSRNYWKILIILLFVVAAGCSDNPFSDKNIEIKAQKLIGKIDSNSIKTFKQWNYSQRGQVNLWSKISSAGTEYTCIYLVDKETEVLRIFQPGNFIKDFPCSFFFDTLKYYRFDLSKHDNVVSIKAIDNNGHDHILERNLELDKLFRYTSPFKKFSDLTTLKDSLHVFSISYRNDIGDFVEFYLSPRHILTYLPDNVFLNPKWKDVWLKEFATGKTLKKNWNLRKLPENNK